MTHVVGISTKSLASILIFATCTTAAIAAPATLKLSAHQDSRITVKGSSATSSNLIASAGLPMPLLPTTKGGSATGSNLIASAGLPMPLLPTTKGGSATGSNLIASAGLPMPLLPTTKGGSATSSLLS
jgi:hypothetical protein